MVNNEIVFAFLAILLVLYLVSPKNAEGFDQDGAEFVGVGSDRYGLRGDLLRRSSIDQLYMRPDREARLNQSGGLMYFSNNSPEAEGTQNCRQVPCPTCSGGYDSSDTCWQCGDPNAKPTKIPYIHPH